MTCAFCNCVAGRAVVLLQTQIHGGSQMEWMLLPLKRYADFEGRSRRMEYWMFQLAQIILYTVLFVIFTVLIGVSGAAGGEEGAGIVSVLLFLVFGLLALGLIVPNIAVTVRRLHDQDKSGWFYLINFIPLGGLVLLVFMFLDGTRGPNQYGPDPKSAEYDPQTFS